MKRNERGLPVLDQGLLDTIFEHVYSDDAADISDKELRDFVELLLAMQKYNYWYRPNDARSYFRCLKPRSSDGDNSEERACGGARAGAQGALRTSQLFAESLLKKITVRK